ncbi:hypothetical protein KOI40_07275 [Aestuariicella sp. G3-2]|uniref:DUF2971 domain-containing protein n=1 Tax=Pseudomaricurvus albidus TaxID=2842452 RepID=UPI001C0DFD65|nr:hypothetical protein [Aestuariicella albida]
MASQSPETLVKYCDAASGKQILESRALRWSAPHLFKDPFELSHESQLNFEPQTLLQSAIKMATAMIFAKDDPRGNTPLITAIRRWRKEERFASPEEAYDVLRELLSRVVDQRLNVLEELMSDWRSYARSLRICSFTGKADNLIAWQQFAQQHQGIAIRFQVGEFTSHPHPVKVDYRSPRPEISTLREEMSIIMGGSSDTPKDFSGPQGYFEEKFTHKPPHCSAEDEWRCFHKLREVVGDASKPAQEWYTDMPFEPGEINAVYFGACTPAATKRELLELLKAKYPRTRIFQGRVIPGQYNIEFERL